MRASPWWWWAASTPTWWWRCRGCPRRARPSRPRGSPSTPGARRARGAGCRGGNGQRHERRERTDVAAPHALPTLPCRRRVPTRQQLPASWDTPPYSWGRWERERGVRKAQEPRRDRPHPPTQPPLRQPCTRWGATRTRPCCARRWQGVAWTPSCCTAWTARAALPLCCCSRGVSGGGCPCEGGTGNVPGHACNTRVRPQARTAL